MNTGMQNMAMQAMISSGSYMTPGSAGSGTQAGSAADQGGNLFSGMIKEMQAASSYPRGTVQAAASGRRPGDEESSPETGNAQAVQMASLMGSPLMNPVISAVPVIPVPAEGITPGNVPVVDQPGAVTTPGSAWTQTPQGTDGQIPYEGSLLSEAPVLSTGVPVQQDVPMQTEAVQQNVPAQAEAVQQSVPAQAEAVQQSVPGQTEAVQQDVPMQAEAVQQSVPTQAEALQQDVPAQTDPVQQADPDHSFGAAMQDAASRETAETVSEGRTALAEGGIQQTETFRTEEGSEVSGRTIQTDSAGSAKTAETAAAFGQQTAVPGERGKLRATSEHEAQQPGTDGSAGISAAGSVSHAAAQATTDPVSETLHLSGADRTAEIERLMELTEKAFASDGKEISIQLEPENLGKITLKAVFENGSASVLITCSDPGGAEKLSQYAADLGVILQERMGQPTQIIVDRQPDSYTEQYGQGSGREERQDDSGEQSRRQKDRSRELEGDFLHQLRLGIM